MRPSSAPEVGGGVEEAMHVLFCICVDICVFLCGVCVSSTPVSVKCEACARRSDLGAALMHKYPYTADTCGYSPSSSITHTVVCVILMYPKYPVSAILPHIKYPLVSWYPWHSRVGTIPHNIGLLVAPGTQASKATPFASFFTSVRASPRRHQPRPVECPPR